MAQKQDESQALELNFSGLKEALIEVSKEQTKNILEALKPSEPQGKGFVMPTEQSNKLIEALKTAPEGGNNWKLTEQWTVVIPNYRIKENKANLRDYVYVSEILKNEPGDVANIPFKEKTLRFLI
jgi:hypothetical protein